MFLLGFCWFPRDEINQLAMRNISLNQSSEIRLRA